MLFLCKDRHSSQQRKVTHFSMRLSDVIRKIFNYPDQSSYVAAHYIDRFSVFEKINFKYFIYYVFDSNIASLYCMHQIFLCVFELKTKEKPMINSKAKPALEHFFVNPMIYLLLSISYDAKLIL